jgi:hypothetical protein
VETLKSVVLGGTVIMSLIASAEVAEQLNFSQNSLCIDQVVEGIRNLLNRPELEAPAFVRVVAVVVVAVLLLLLLILAALALALRLLAGLAVVEGANRLTSSAASRGPLGAD